MHRTPPDDDPERWRESIHAFVRKFGLLEPSTTPCGQPLPTSHAHALMELLKRPDSSQNELAERLGLRKSTVSRLVDRLEQDGRLVRKADGGDRRVRRLRLTPKGRRLAVRVNQSSIERFERLMQGVPPAMRERVLQTLDLLARAASAPGEVQD